MPLQIIRNDITKVQCDAIVNAANCTLLGGGGVDGAIHKAAGRELLLECMKLGGCKVGQAKITKGYNLPCKYIIHTVGPKWKDGKNGEREQLESCYKNSLETAKKYHCESVAFPLISSGVYGYPKDEALQVAIDSITSFLINHDMLVYIVVFDKSAFQISEKLFTDIAEYIDDKYVDTNFDFRMTRANKYGESTILGETEIFRNNPDLNISEKSVTSLMPSQAVEHIAPRAASLDDALNQIDESFSEMLLRLIDERGMKDSECYKKANIDKRLFSKIRSNPNYKPSKPTVLAFCIALELSLAKTNEMLMKAGFALSHSNKFDIIVEYFINQNNYNIFEINEALFAFDQILLGSGN